jgi:hypothetical protein
MHGLKVFPVESLRPEGLQYTHFGAGLKRETGGDFSGKIMDGCKKMTIIQPK